MEKVRPEQLCVRIFVGTIQEDTMTVHVTGRLQASQD